MVWKVIFTILIFLILIFSVASVFENFNVKPVDLKVNYLEPESSEVVDYGAVPVFDKNMRFNHNLISYTIADDCSRNKREEMVAAFNIFSNEVKIISFYEGDEDSDIKVVCSSDFVGLGENYFAAGEGGPSIIINTSRFKVIEEGKITLYRDIDCDYPIVALHELCHVFGFAHTLDPKNIMFNVSNCGQRMSEDMGELMRKLYSIEALPDVRVESVDGVIHGRYLDFNISVLNEGLLGVEGVNLTIFADGDFVDVVDLGKIEVGYGRVLRIENMRVGSGVDVLRFVLDADNNIRELDKTNNVVEMRPK